MRRRQVLGILSAAVAWPALVRAQQAGSRVARIAYLGPSGANILDPRQIEQFKIGLAENGLIPGQNVTVEYFWADGSLDRLKELAAELGRRDLDVIVTVGPQAIRFLQATGTKTPIVLAVIGDILADRIVDSLARPNGNVTGLSMSNADLESKRIQLLKEAVPAVTRLLLLHDPSMGPAGLAEAQNAARSLAIESLVIEAADPSQFDAVFAEAMKAGVNGIAAMASPILNRHRKPLIALVAQNRLPSIWEAGIYVRDGGLLSYGPSFADMYRRSAGYVAKILAGAKPEDLPIQLPVKFELVVNLQTARALGRDIPATLLARADEIVE